MDSILIQMIEIYKPNGIDWMNYHLEKKNPYTYHHIKEVRNGGKRTIQNGAILTKQAHEYLNYIDREYHKIYKELNGLFLELNRTYKPPEEDYFQEVNHVLLLVPTWKRKK